jgi:glycosyltransferase involved in cell wall biosynthesis
MDNNKMIDVSVIIPTHNRPLLARRAVASVLAQTISNIEIIVIDDCSDESFNVQATINTLNDNRVIYKRHSISKGPSASRNTGINASSGNYIAFLDDDDLWLENKLEKQLANIGDYGASLTGFFTQYGNILKKKINEVGYRELKQDRNYALNSGLVVKSDLLIILDMMNSLE